MSRGVLITRHATQRVRERLVGRAGPDLETCSAWVCRIVDEALRAGSLFDVAPAWVECRPMNLREQKRWVVTAAGETPAAILVNPARRRVVTVLVNAIGGTADEEAEADG